MPQGGGERTANAATLLQSRDNRNARRPDRGLMPRPPVRPSIEAIRLCPPMRQLRRSLRDPADLSASPFSSQCRHPERTEPRTPAPY
ncbi:hypothetical protein MTO96_002775 [Rhipicephalus appendiculatus]